MSLYEVKNKKKDNLFLNEQIAKQFSENGFSFLYLMDGDCLFAVQNIIFPYQDYPMLDFMGMEINQFRGVAFNKESVQMIKKLCGEIELVKFKINGNVKFIYEEVK